MRDRARRAGAAAPPGGRGIGLGSVSLPGEATVEAKIAPLKGSCTGAERSPGVGALGPVLPVSVALESSQLHVAESGPISEGVLETARRNPSGRPAPSTCAKGQTAEGTCKGGLLYT